MRAGWINYQPWLESNDKAFRVHVGGRFMYDAVFAHAPLQVQNGIGGLGEFTDAVVPRRARLQADGWLYETFDFMSDYEFLGQEVNVDPTTRATRNNTIDTPTPAQLWAGVNFLPVIGIIRAGNQRAPIGLDRVMSSNFTDFMERSLGFDAFLNANGNFMPGIQMLNWTPDERMTWQVGLFKDNKRLFGWNLGGGQYAAVGRVTWLPWYEYNGRYMIHLGLGAQANALEDGSVTFKSRPLIRNAPPGLLASTSMVTINNGDNQNIINPEFFMNISSLSIQAEYQGCWVHNVTSVTTLTGTRTVPRQTFFGQSYYVQAVYFLTGERRPYNRIPLHHSGASPTQVVPIRNFFWLPGYGVPNPFSTGAWQVGVRYDYLDLNSGSINGGRINEVTAGLIWHLNPNMRIYLNYDIGYRTIPGGTSSGTFQELGSRMGVNF
jgi:phosphate-selective porin OprO/OprP